LTELPWFRWRYPWLLFFANGQMTTGLKILSEHMNGKFFKLGRFFKKGENVVDMNYIDKVMTTQAPLRWPGRRRKGLLHPFGTATTSVSQQIYLLYTDLMA